MTTHQCTVILHLVAFMALSAGFFGFLASGPAQGVVAPHTAAAAITISEP